ncbi:hypothetical protein COY06_03370 [Candidatus Peregrinibacteria bacterium CG_4_10_14_0_2_um_filter_41_8]|nr:MAG: hypothetical protein COY06_03370 [Candidatus Peregrinibacteria bacterium CG_4_10_14_0_2_um_filter_41_8]
MTMLVKSSMAKKKENNALIQIPLGALKCLSSKGEKVILEINIKELKKVNQARTLDELISEARLDYASGDYKSFDNTDDLIAELNS